MAQKEWAANCVQPIRLTPLDVRAHKVHLVREKGYKPANVRTDGADG